MLLPAVMVAQKIAMIGKETDESIFRVRTPLDRIEDFSETMIQITDLAVISRLHDSGKLRVDRVCPNSVTHESDLLVEVIFRDGGPHGCGHPIRIVHSVEGNRRRQRGMRTQERYKSKKRAPIIGSDDLFHCALSRPKFGAEVCGKRTALRQVIHFGAFAHRLLEEREFWMFANQPRAVIIALGSRRVIRLLAAPQCFVSQIFIPGIRVEFSHAESSVAELLHRPGQVRTAALLHAIGLPRRGPGLHVTEHAGRWRFAAGSDGVASRDADQTRGICVRETDSPPHKPIKVRRVNGGIAQRGDGIEPLLVGHDKENIWTSRRHFLKTIPLRQSTPKLFRRWQFPPPSNGETLPDTLPKFSQ